MAASEASLTLGTMPVGSQGYLRREDIDGTQKPAALIDDALVEKDGDVVPVKRVRAGYYEVRLRRLGSWTRLSVLSGD